jgi:hypothetical protein
MDVASLALMQRYYPDVPLRGAVDGYESLLSSARARSLLGYRPLHSWRDV